MKTLVFSLAMIGGGGALLAETATTTPAKDAAENCCMKMGQMTKEGMMCGPKSPAETKPAPESKTTAPTKSAADDHSAHH